MSRQRLIPLRLTPRQDALLKTTVILLLLLAAWWLTGRWYRQQLEGERHSDAALEVTLRGNALSAAASRRFARLEGLQAFILTEATATADPPTLDPFVRALYADSRGVRNFTVARGGVIGYVHPLAGNEIILDRNLFEDPRQDVRDDIQRALETGEIALSEPYELLQGGLGVVARLAVFQEGQFWGLVAMTLDVPTLLAEAEIGAAGGELALALRDSRGQVFYGSPEVFDNDPVTTQISLPEGAWQLAGAPQEGWTAAVARPWLIFQTAGLIIVGLIAGLAHLTLSRQSTLAQAVKVGTQELSNANRALQRDIAHRARMETAVRESEARFRALFQEAPFGIAIQSLDGKILDANARLQTMLGYDWDELRTISATVPVEADEPTTSAALLARPQPDHQREQQYRRQDGELAWGRLTTYPVPDPVGRPQFLITMVEDITEQKRSAEQLQEKEAQYRSIFESTSDGVFINDFDGRLIDFNPAAHEMHGYTREEFSQIRPQDFIHPDSHDRFANFLTQVQANGHYRVRAVDLRKDGTPFHVEVLGSLFTYRGQPHALAVVRDVTERVRAYQLLEERVAERTHELSTLLQASNRLAATLDLDRLMEIIIDQLQRIIPYDAAGIYLRDQEDSVRLLQYRGPLAGEELPERWDLRHAPQARAVLDDRRPIIIGNVTDNTAEARQWRMTLEDQLNAAAPGYVAAWMSVPLIVGEQAIGILAFDSSQPDAYNDHHADLALAFANQAAAAIENARLYEEAQRASALAERQRLARELHDSVSQALYGIALGARTARTLLARDPAQAAEPLDYVLSLAEAGLSEMRALIFELRPETLETEGLVGVLNRLADSLQARHAIVVERELGAEPPIRLAAKEALYRVAQEAMHNTIRHAGATAVSLSLAVRDGVLTLAVRDDGQGFDPTAAFPGHLGLQSMRERMEKLSGRLIIDSAPGRGTAVTVMLPLV